jgi:hypothetical protein
MQNSGGKLMEISKTFGGLRDISYFCRGIVEEQT